MSDISQATDAPPPAAPKQKRKYVRRAKPAARPASPTTPTASIYAGLEYKCAYACKPERCVITHGSLCGKGALQGKYATDPGCLRRAAEAKAYLEHFKVDKRNKI